MRPLIRPFKSSRQLAQDALNVILEQIQNETLDTGRLPVFDVIRLSFNGRKSAKNDGVDMLSQPALVENVEKNETQELDVTSARTRALVLGICRCIPENAHRHWKCHLIELSADS